jgi:hypothetical protein
MESSLRRERPRMLQPMAMLKPPAWGKVLKRLLVRGGTGGSTSSGNVTVSPASTFRTRPCSESRYSTLCSPSRRTWLMSGVRKYVCSAHVNGMAVVPRLITLSRVIRPPV